MSPEVTLNRIAPALSPFISSVVRNGKVGLDSTSCLRITDLKSGYVSADLSGQIQCGVLMSRTARPSSKSHTDGNTWKLL